MAAAKPKKQPRRGPGGGFGSWEELGKAIFHEGAYSSFFLLNKPSSFSDAKLKELAKGYLRAFGKLDRYLIKKGAGI